MTVVEAVTKAAARASFGRQHPTLPIVSVLGADVSGPAPADPWLQDRDALRRAALYFGSSSAVRCTNPPSASGPTPPAIPEPTHSTLAVDILCPTAGCAGYHPVPVASSRAAAGAAGEGVGK